MGVERRFRRSQTGIVLLQRRGALFESWWSRGFSPLFERETCRDALRNIRHRVTDLNYGAVDGLVTAQRANRL